MRKWQSLALGLIISLATLAYALNGVDLTSLRDEFARGRYVFVVPGLLLGLAGLGFRALRWRALLNERITLPHSFNILNVGYFFGAVLPLRLGDVVRMFLATRLDPPISAFTALSSMVVERLTDTLAVVMMVVLAVSLAPVTPQVEAAARLSGIAAIGGLLVLAVLAARRVWAHRLVALAVRAIPLLQRLNPAQLVDRVLDGIAPLGSVRGAALTLGLTAAAWTCSISEGYVLMAVFYGQPSWDGTLLMIAIGALAVALPAVPGSVGPFEAAVVTGLAIAGLAPPELKARALAFAVLVHVANTGTFAVMGWIGLLQENITLAQIIQSAQALTRRKRADAPDVVMTPQ